MKDLKIDFDNKKILNIAVDRQDRVFQQAKVAIRSWKKDFFINEDFGVDYNNSWHDDLLMNANIVSQLKQIDGINAIQSSTVKREKDINDRTYFQLNTNIALDNDVINITETIGENINDNSI